MDATSPPTLPSHFRAKPSHPSRVMWVTRKSAKPFHPKSIITTPCKKHASQLRRAPFAIKIIAFYTISCAPEPKTLRFFKHRKKNVLQKLNLSQAQHSKNEVF